MAKSLRKVRSGLTPESKKRFHNKMAQLAKFIQPNQGLSKLLAMTGMIILKNSAKIVPVDQGALRGSAYMKGSSFMVEIGYGAEYAKFVEFGTRGENLLSSDTKIVVNEKKGKYHGTRPFFFPTVHKEIKEFRKKWSNEIVKISRKK